ncbi:MAG: hypothetical protein IKF82_01735 [Bacilli bacterium]|nr:hypothetical protein [Bacilli bacterium]
MNKKIGLFGRIWRFIDRKIIVKITRFLMRLVKWFSNSNRTLENFLSRSNTLLFVSLFLAVSVFIFIDRKMSLFTSTNAEVLRDRPVEVEYNNRKYVFEGLPEKVDITLMGSRSDLFIAKQGTAKVKVDLSKLKPGTHKVAINYVNPSSSIEYSVNPSVATVNIYPKVSATKTIAADLLNQDRIDSKLAIESVKLSDDSVVIQGADDENAINSLKKVAIVKALIDVKDLSSDDIGTVTIKNIPLRAYDKDGNILDVEFTKSKISADIVVASPSKTVPIKVIPKGEIDFGKAISSIQMSSTNIVVYGKQSVLDELQYVPVTMNVDNLSENKETRLEITKPKGIKSMSLSNITVSLTLGDATDRTIDNVNIDVRNLRDNYTVQGVTADDIKVSVSVKGVAGVINSLTNDDIKAYIDLKNINKPGEYEVSVEVEGTDSRVSYVSKTKKVKIRVVEK